MSVLAHAFYVLSLAALCAVVAVLMIGVFVAIAHHRGQG